MAFPIYGFSPRDIARVKNAFFLFPKTLTVNLDKAIQLTAFSIQKDIGDAIAKGGPTGWPAFDTGNMANAVTIKRDGPLSRVVGVAGRRSKIATMLESGTGIHHAPNPFGHLVGLNVPRPPAGGGWITPKNGKMMRFKIKKRKRNTPPAGRKPPGYRAWAKVIVAGKAKTITNKTNLGNTNVVIFATHIQGMKPRYMISDPAIKNVPVFRRNVEAAARATLGQTLSKIL